MPGKTHKRPPHKPITLSQNLILRACKHFVLKIHKQWNLLSKNPILAFVVIGLILILSFQNCKSGILQMASVENILEPEATNDKKPHAGDNSKTNSEVEEYLPNQDDSSTTTTTEMITTTITTTTTIATLPNLSCENRQIDPQKASKSGPNLTYKPCNEGEKCVDILFVVDNSTSMPRYLDRLAYHFSVLESGLQGVNWQMAIINSNSNPERKSIMEDGYEGTFYHLENQYGEISYNNQKVTILTPELGKHFYLANLFLNTVKCLESKESIWEYHFFSVLYATELYSSSHADFFRDGADFVVILFTDEGDHGAFINYRRHRSSRVEIVSKVREIFPSKDFVVHGIFHKENSCKNETLPNEEAKWDHKIVDVISETGGIARNICDPDHTQHLRDIASAIKQN